MADKICVGDIGTEILVNMGRDISTANQHFFCIKKPSGVETQWAAIKVGKTELKYIIQRNDLNEVGTYILQVYIQLPAWAGRSTSVSFVVYEKFK